MTGAERLLMNAMQAAQRQGLQPERLRIVRELAVLIAATTPPERLEGLADHIARLAREVTQ